MILLEHVTRTFSLFLNTGPSLFFSMIAPSLNPRSVLLGLGGSTSSSFFGSSAASACFLFFTIADESNEFRVLGEEEMAVLFVSTRGRGLGFCFCHLGRRVMAIDPVRTWVDYTAGLLTEFLGWARLWNFGPWAYFFLVCAFKTFAENRLSKNYKVSLQYGGV